VRRTSALALAAALTVSVAACGGPSTSAPVEFAATTSQVHALGATVVGVSHDRARLDVALHNVGAQVDALLSITCTCANAVEIHDVGHGSTLGPSVAAVTLPSEKMVFFEAGGRQIVLTGLTEPLASGDTVDLTFTFRISPSATAVATVKAH
jgi:copper(I)-binding protein